ncbi:MAG: NUDIX hydrolase [Chloroflexi bacterium]|nr:MAG: NUDIX hydrolase [Chloroflexota bacterium]
MMFKVLKTETFYEGKAFTVRKDLVEFPNGNRGNLDIVEHTGAVTLVPVDEQGQVWFVRQYRHAAGRELLELPAGTLEKNEEPEACALREVREEIGMAAGNIELVGEFFLAPGYSTEHMYIFLATRLRDDPLQGDEDEFLNIEKRTIREAIRMAENGEFLDAKTIAALMLVRNRFG